MTAVEFNYSVHTDAAPPAGLSRALQALWWMMRDDWEQAHATAQEDSSADGAWVHAHLHRVEGDLENAAYWYRRAGRTPEGGSLEAERAVIAADLLARDPDGSS